MKSDEERPVLVPYRDLSPTTLRAVIEAFVGREGTDYGHRDIPIESKVADVMRQLERGDVLMVYEAKSETVTIVPADEYRDG